MGLSLNWAVRSSGEGSLLEDTGGKAVDPRVGCVSTLRSGPLGWDIAPGSTSSVTVRCGWVNEGDPGREGNTASECTGCREEVDPS